MELELRAKELIQKIEYLNIATTSKAGSPWNTPVYAVADSELNFYWSSWKEAQHSLNINENPKVFCTLYDSARKRGDNNRRCLYFDGQANEILDKEEVTKAIGLIYPTELDQHKAEDYLGEGLRRFYKVKLMHAWLNDISERQVTKETIKMRVNVNELKKALNSITSQETS
jgi:nitroimidazol reductase NimA-like FMN-containing flavoprotein (pyridoxamine 5'-phosphate oxidase superfamily)